jgi:acid phosphatase
LRAALAVTITILLAAAANTSRPARAAATVPAFDHVFIVVEENKGYSEIIGSPQAPYINSLASQNGLAIQYSAVAHPSLLNYLALTGGSTFGLIDNCEPTACPIDAPNIADRIEGAGKTWRAYMDAMTAACGTSSSGTYAARHDPFVYYNDIRNDPVRCANHVVPYSNLAADLGSVSTTPNYAWITPDLCNDMHDCGISVGDTWLKNNLPALFSSPAWTTQKSVLLLTWDEDSTANQVATLVIGPSVSPGYQSAAVYNHYSLLSTVESAWGLAPLTSNDANAGPMSDFFTSTTKAITYTAVSTQSYALSNNDGSTWATMDATNLVKSVTPSVDSTAVLGGNVDLFTNGSGYNQDIGIFVRDGAGADQLVAWKESGGFAGTFSPNAAFVQGVYSMTAGHTYTCTLKWKTNKPEASGATIYAGAGPIAGQFSPTRLTAEVLPTGANPYTAGSTQSYTLSNNDGSTWATMDASNLVKSVTPSADSTAVVGANVDLWTATTGYNQDIGIFVRDGAGADQLVAWKESGGFAGTFSPNAAFVQSVSSMTAGHTYTFTLKWKTNKPEATGATIYAGAGPIAGQFSPTRLTAEVLPAGANPYTAVSTQYYTLSNSDGSTWATMDATNLVKSVTPSVDSTAVLGANADLWTDTTGYNQDIGIFVRDGAGADQLVAWKESGGFAGTFSPKPAFVQSVYRMTAGHTYTFTLRWKTNKAQAAGATIYAGAGPITGQWSPTRLIAQIN